MKPHIYQWRGKWYCCKDYFREWDISSTRQLGIGSDSPVEAFRLAKEYWKWLRPKNSPASSKRHLRRTVNTRWRCGSTSGRSEWKRKG